MVTLTQTSSLTSGKGLFKLQLMPPTRTILGIRGRGNSSMKSYLCIHISHLLFCVCLCICACVCV